MLYMVHTPPGVRSVTVTPTWENSGIGSVSLRTFDVTSNGIPRRHDALGIPLSTAVSSASGTGSVLNLRRGNGSTLLAVDVAWGSTYAVYWLFVAHNNAWKSADARLKGLTMQPTAGGQDGGQNSGRNGGLSARPAVRFDREFREDTETYGAEVPRDVTEVKLAAQTGHGRRRLTVYDLLIVIQV